jgi:hypothetical protein
VEISDKVIFKILNSPTKVVILKNGVEIFSTPLTLYRKISKPNVKKCFYKHEKFKLENIEAGSELKLLWVNDGGEIFLKKVWFYDFGGTFTLGERHKVIVT